MHFFSTLKALENIRQHEPVGKDLATQNKQLNKDLLEGMNI
jgi:hypothetical protein